MKGEHLESNGSNLGKENGNEAASNCLNGKVVLGDLIWAKIHDSSWWPAQIVDENTVGGSRKPSDSSAGEVLVRLYGSYKYIYVNPMECHLEFENILKQHNGSYTEILKKALEQTSPKRQLPERTGKAKTEKQKEDRLRKKPKPNCPVSLRVSPRRKSDATEKKAVEKNGKVPGLQKKLKPNCPVSLRVSPRRKLDATETKAVEKNGKVLSTKAKGVKSKKRDQDGALKKLETNSPSKKLKQAEATTSVEKLQELSARRMKVMQTLGLIAPSGSPFDRNGKIYPKLSTL